MLVRYSPTINTEASPNPNGLNPDVTVGRMAIADPGFSGLTPLNTAHFKAAHVMLSGQELKALWSSDKFWFTVNRGL